MQPTIDKRAGKRVSLVAPVNCTSLDEEEAGFSGILIDKSLTGLGMYTYYPLDAGQEIELFGDALWSDCLVANVKWTRQVSNDLFRVGLNFN